MLLLKRMRQRASVFVALLAVVAIGSGLLVGVIGMLNTAETDGVRAQLANRSGADIAFELSLRSEPDGAKQDSRVDSLLARVFANGNRVLPIGVTRTIVSDSPVALSTGVKAFVASVPELDSHAVLVNGTWPRSGGEATVQADAAAGLGLTPGDELDVGDTRVVITGTWRVSDALDPRWVSDPLFLDGHRGVVLGPLVVAEGDLAAVGSITNTRWAIAPHVQGLRAGDLDVFIRGWSTMADSLRSDGGFNVNSFHSGGRFAGVATEIQSNVLALRAVALVVLLIIGALTALTIVELARLLATTRSTEYLLFWSRGDTVRALTLAAAAEAAVASFVGAVLGTVAAGLIVGQPIGSLGASAFALPAAGVFVSAAVFAARTSSSARAITRTAVGEESGRSGRVVGIAAPVFLGIGAVVSTWQLLQYGSPLSPTRDGATQVDPVGVFAPTLCLLALVAVVNAILPLAGNLLDRASTRSAGRALVMRTLARRTRLFTSAFVLCALAAGQLTIASAYAQTWESAYSTATALRAGSDLSLEDSHSPLTEEVLDAVADVGGVDSLAPVYSEPAKVGATSASMVAVTPVALALLGTNAGGVFDTGQAADQIALPLTGPLIPEGTREVTVTASSDGAVPVGLTLVIADELGVQREVRATGSYQFGLPVGHGDWNVLALIVRLSQDGPTDFAVTELDADGVAVDISGGWSAQGFDPLRAPVTSDPAGAGFSDALGLESVRLAPLFGAFTDDVHPPVLISRELARIARIRVGDTVPVDFDRRSAPFASVVVGIVPAIPGAKSELAVLMDASLVEAVRARFYETTPAPQVAWVSAADPASALPQVREVVPAGVMVSALAVDANREILGTAARALWVAAAGAVLLCVIAVLATVGVQVRTRRGEIGILRALGVSDGEIAVGRSAELGIILLLGLVVGVGAGLVVDALTIGPLARAAVPGSYAAVETVTSLQPFGLVAGLVTLVIGFSLCLWYYRREVAR